MAIYSVIDYQYRDASGYKAFGKLLIEGVVSDADFEALEPYMYDNEFFTPEDVGIAPLQSILWDQFGGPKDDDHDWHTFEGAREAQPEDMVFPAWGTKEELLKRFRTIMQ